MIRGDDSYCTVWAGESYRYRSGHRVLLDGIRPRLFILLSGSALSGASWNREQDASWMHTETHIDTQARTRRAITGWLAGRPF